MRSTVAGPVRVCAGLQIIGSTFPGVDGKVHAGAEIVDVTTAPGS